MVHKEHVFSHTFDMITPHHRSMIFKMVVNAGVNEAGYLWPHAMLHSESNIRNLVSDESLKERNREVVLHLEVIAVWLWL